jgi:hypothetical protein
MKSFPIAASLALLLLAAGCISMGEDQREVVQTTVSPSTSETLYLVVNQPLDNTDDIDDPSQGVALPIGKYKLESEDADYYYFRASKPIMITTYEFGHQRNGVRIYGGIALGKNDNNAAPTPHAYVDDSKSKNSKILVWKMSPDFLLKRGQKWFLSTDKKDTQNTATLPAAK